MKTTEKTGCVVGALTVHDEDEIMLITVGGQMVRTNVKDIREAPEHPRRQAHQPRVRDWLQAIAPVISEERGRVRTARRFGVSATPS
jgi:DNA gyrase/topoisomerase IV subunit A